MYAAAGGASLASRQARQRQRQNKKLQQLKQHKELKPAPAKQYHNYTDDVNVTLPKLSRVERGALRPPPAASPHERRHSTSNYRLKEPPKSRLRESPSICIPVQINRHAPPATSLVENHVASSFSLQLPQILIPDDDGKLERRCSFVRQVEEMKKSQEKDLLDRCNHLCNFEIKNNKIWENSEYDIFSSLDYPFSECSQGRAAWQERERGRRCSLSEEARQHRIKQSEAHHRWIKRNRIHDSTYGGGSDEDDSFGLYHQSAAANALLYVGLGTTAIGCVIFFVGTGEKGFKTLELRLIGPTLIACGLLCCLIRVLLCACPSTCLQKKKKTRLKDNDPYNLARYPLASKGRHPTDFHSDSFALLSHKHKKKVSIVPPNHPLPSTSTTMGEIKETPPPSAMVPLAEKPECASSLATENVIPQINLPDNSKTWQDDPAKNNVQHLELVYDDIESITSNSDTEGDSVTVVETTALRHHEDTETCLSIVIEKNGVSDSEKEDVDKQTHSGIVLSPLQLGQ